MSTTAGSTGERSDLPFYEVCLQGHFDSRWAARLEGLAFTLESDGTTTLTGHIADQAALHGLLSQLRDIGVPIVSLRRIDSEEGEQPTP